MSATIMVSGLVGQAGIEPLGLELSEWVQAGAEVQGDLINLQGFARFKSRAGTMRAEITEECFLEMLREYVAYDEAGEAVKAVLETLEGCNDGPTLLKHLGKSMLNIAANVVENDDESYRSNCADTRNQSWDGVYLQNGQTVYEIEHDQKYKTVYEVDDDGKAATVKTHEIKE